MPPRLTTGSVYDQGQRVLVDDLETWVVRAGPQGDTPVVMLHGIPTSAYLYRDIVFALHEERDCIAFDWPGFGQSEAPPNGDYTHRPRADHLGAVLDALDLERVDLVVHDLGGPAGLLFAIENPERIRRLVVLNTTVFKRDYHPPLPAVAQFVPGLRQASRRVFTRALFDLFLKQGLARPERISRQALDNHWDLLQAGAGATPIFESWAQIPEGRAAIRTIRDGMGSFQKPVLVLFGAEDRFLPPPNAERFAKAFPDAQMHLLPGVGHFLQEDAPDLVAEHLTKFLA